jgi:hypothetical protein
MSDSVSSEGVLSEKLLECSICYGMFKRPVSLVPCGHSFCEGCWLQHIQSASLNQRVLACPLCRNDKAVQYFRNLALDSIVEARRELGRPVTLPEPDAASDEEKIDTQPGTATPVTKTKDGVETISTAYAESARKLLEAEGCRDRMHQHFPKNSKRKNHPVPDLEESRRLHACLLG